MKLKNTIKKVAVAALLATPLVSSVVNTNTVSAAMTAYGDMHVDPSQFGPGVHVSYPGLTDDSENASSWDMYDVDAGGTTSWRNFKTRSANIYVKDKSLLPATKKAIKFWSPVFKFKLVKSAKHASFHSKKYANVVIYDENYENVPTGSSLTSTRVYENKNKKVIKYTSRRYQPYANGHFTAKDLPFLKKHPNSLINDDFAPKAVKKDHNKAFTNHLNMVVRTKNNSQQAITNKIIYELGQTIGLGGIDNDSNPTDIMRLVDPLTPINDYDKIYRLTQADKDHIDWIYSHPYTGEVNADHAAEAHAI